MNNPPSLQNMTLQIANCEAKVPFATRGAAMIFVDKHGYDHGVYKCPICSFFHLTSKREGY